MQGALWVAVVLVSVAAARVCSPACARCCVRVGPWFPATQQPVWSAPVFQQMQDNPLSAVSPGPWFPRPSPPAHFYFRPRQPSTAWSVLPTPSMDARPFAEVAVGPWSRPVRRRRACAGCGACCGE